MQGMSDITERLRAAWQQPFATDADPRALLLEAADEIERLRLELFMRPVPNLLVRADASPLRLTDAQREAVEAAIRSLLDDPYDGAPVSPHAATLRGLLERLGGEK